MPRSVIDSGQVHIDIRDPIANDDYSAGYSFGSEWINSDSTPLRYFKCTNPSIGVAVWNKMTIPSDLFEIKDNYEDPTKFVASTMNNWVLYKAISIIGSRANDSNPVFFNPSGADYIEITSNTYEVRANIVYRGTGIWTPNTLIVMVSRSNSTGTGYFRVYDYDNVAEICERSFINVDKETHIFTLTPTEIARFQSSTASLEFQLRKSGGGAGKIFLHAAGLYVV